MAQDPRPREVRWERMFVDELEAAFAACPVVYYPYGLCEPHGPQCTLGLDALKAHAIACRVASEYGGIVAPPDYWHIHDYGDYASWAATNIGEVPRAWLTAMPPWQHFKNLCYHVRAADKLGFRVAVFLTGHYGPNWKDLKTILEWLQPFTPVRLYGLPDFEANEPGFDGATGDHAGKVETSLLWSLEPCCVDVSRLPSEAARESGIGAPYFAMGPSAPLADRRIGDRMVEDEVRFLSARVNELLAQPVESKPSSLQTFSDVERIWKTDIEPRLGTLASMQSWGETPPPLDSRWFASWQDAASEISVDIL